MPVFDRPSPEHLFELYINQRLSSIQIAKRYGVEKISVLRWLKQAGIERRPAGEGLANQGRPLPTPEDLYRMIHVEHQSYQEIGRFYGFGKTALGRWLDKYKIERSTTWKTRNKGWEAPELNQAQVVELYEQGFSQVAIADLLNTKPSYVLAFFKKCGITSRLDGWKGGRRHLSTDGHSVRSTYELRVCEWLFAHEVDHLYEPALPPDPRMQADFLANGWYIEVWGVVNNPAYEERKQRKQAIYLENNLPLIELGVDFFTSRRKERLQARLTRCLEPPPPCP